MIYVFIIAIFVFLCNARFSERNEFYEDYISKSSTTAVNGIFVVLVFMCHIGGHLERLEVDQIWFQFKGFLNQLVVVTFLFYSGYGMMSSYLRKGRTYVQSIFKNHFLRLLAHFDIAVVLFYIVDLILKRNVTFHDFLMALTTWKSIGNSNWYITAVLCMYILMLVSFIMLYRHNFLALSVMSVLTVGLTFVFIKAGRPDYCYNTLTLFPLGMWYAYFRKNIDHWVMKNNMHWMLAMLAAVFCFAVGYKYRRIGVEAFALWSCSFMLMLVLLTMKLKIGNPILNILGSHVFSIYILQRIPMMILSRKGFAENGLIFFCLCFAFTIVIALLSDRFLGKFDSLVFK